MYLRIIRNSRLPVRNRIKNLLAYYLKRRAAKIGWSIRFNQLFGVHPEYKTPCKKELENAHCEYWKPFSNNINLDTFRVCNNISSNSDPRFVPEEIFMSDIEATLNQDVSIDYYNNKSLYNQWSPENVFPVEYIHNIDGEFLDSNLKTISFDQVVSIAGDLSYPVVIKPTKDSGGGKNVFFPKNAGELIEQFRISKNVVVQEKIQQHEYFTKFNQHGLNTIRICLYRSVIDNSVNVLNSTLRMGLGGSLDNETAGGIYSLIKKNGQLNGYALDKFGTRYLSHPDTKIDFNGQIPAIEELYNLAKKITHKIFYARIVSLDACYDVNSQWRILEANVLGQHTIRFAQYSGEPFFNKFTDEVIGYCLERHWALGIGNERIVV
jgi:hypothetical protein